MAVGAFAALVLIDEPAYGGLVKISMAQGLSVEEHLAPVLAHRVLAVPQDKAMSRPKFVNTFKQRIGSRDVAISQVEWDDGAVHHARNSRMHQDGLDLRGKDEAVSVVVVITGEPVHAFTL